MKQFVRGRYSRAISCMLMALLLLPGLMLPIGSVSWAATGGRQNIVLLPLTTSVGNAPNNLGERILQELQISLASQLGIQATELTLNSPIFIRAKEAMEDEDRSTLVDQYNKAIDPSTDHSTRIKAAGYLAQALGVDSVLYGTIDQYEFTTDPDPKQTFIHLNATKVMMGKDNQPVASPVIVVGQSKARVNDKNSQAFHDQEAIINIAQSLGDQLTGRVTPASMKERMNNAASEKKNNTLLYSVLGVLLVAAAVAAGSSHSSGGSSGGGGGSTIITPDPASALAAKESTTQVSGLTIKQGYPILSWLPSSSQNVTSYQIWRDTAGTLARSHNESITGGSKLPVFHGVTSRSATRLQATTTRTALSRTAQQIATVASTSALTYSDQSVQSGVTYEYYVLAVATSGSQTATSTLSNEVLFGPVDMSYPAIIPQGALSGADDTTAPINVDLKWTAPGVNNDGSPLMLPGSFQIYRSTTLPPLTNTQTVAQIMDSGSSFMLVTTISWQNASGQYNYTDTSAPGSSVASYAIVALDSDGHFDYSPSANYPLVQVVTPLHQGIVVSAAQSQLVVTNPQTGASLNPSSSTPSTTQVSATVFQNGMPTPNQSVLFTSSDASGAFPIGATANTNSSGTAYVTYRGGSLTGTPVTLSAVSGALNGSIPTPITMLPGVPASLTNTLVNTTFTTGTGTIVVKDANSNVVPGVQVTLSTDNFTLNNLLVTTDNTGTATYTISTNGAVGSADVTASISGTSLSQVATIQFVAQPNPQIVSGALNVLQNTATSYTMILKNQLWLPLANTSVIAKISNSTVSPSTAANTGTLASATVTTPALQDPADN